MEEQNDLNNGNPQPYNNKQQSKYQHLFLSEQLIQNQSNVEPLMQPSQLYCTPQINYDNNYQTKPQNNNITSLNNETISRKRKIIQKLLGIILYLLILFCFIDLKLLFSLIDSISFNNNNNNTNLIIFLILSLLVFIFAILDVINALLIAHYTGQNKSSRTISTFIISIFLCIIDGLRHILYFSLENYDDEQNIILVFDIFDFSLNVGILLFNLKSKCFKYCD